MNTKVAAKVSCLFFIIGVRFIAADKEFDVVPKLYEEIGCTEIKSDSNKRSFNCPDFSTHDINKCYINGKVFDVDDAIDENIVPSCRTDCHCKKNGAGAEIDCADIECPEVFDEPEPNCISIYDDLKQCCSTSEICDKEKLRSLSTCEVEGLTYHIGERMYPEKSGHECLCVDGFNNATSYADNPNCAKYDCGIQLEMNSLRKGCVPVYFKSPNHCPIEYKCPSADDAIESKSIGSDGQSCKFGKLNFNVGDRLKDPNECLTCECSIPPFLTCIQTC